jgi:8-oxo-dGTP pyrophosphatase MutT (NUDIX family)
MAKKVAAIIIKEGKVFATQRGYGDWKGWWEFPGGKIEPDEEPRAAFILVNLIDHGNHAAIRILRALTT